MLEIVPHSESDPPRTESSHGPVSPPAIAPHPLFTWWLIYVSDQLLRDCSACDQVTFILFNNDPHSHNLLYYIVITVLFYY